MNEVSSCAHENYHIKFNNKSYDEALGFFVRNGYVVLEEIHDKDIVSEISSWIQTRLDRLVAASKDKKIPFDVNGWAVAIVKDFEQTDLYQKFITRRDMLVFLQKILGPDLCIFGQEALWINYPTDTDPVLNKGIHTDAWTGTSINTLFSKYFVTDVDDYNGMTVVPASHLYGLVPCRNRAVDPYAHLDDHLTEINLNTIKAGDVLVWHALLLHATRGHSDKNTRISITSRYSSTESSFSSQERSLGYRPLTVGPLNQILRLIGNDLLSPFRTLGGFVGVDRRLKHLYGFSDYKNDVDYSEWFKD